MTTGKRISAVIAPTSNQLNAAAVKKVKHPEAPYEYAQLDEELKAQREGLATMAELITDDPENFDRYFDQVAETGQARQEVTTTAKQIPAKKAPARKAITRKQPSKSGNPAKKAAAKKAAPKAIAPVEPQLAPGQTISVPIVPVPPQRPGTETVQQEE